MCTRLLVLLALQAGFAYCFTWDIVVSEAKRLVFYNHGILTHTEEIPSAREIFSVTYDPVNYRVLFADNHRGIQNISSFDLSTRNIQHLVTRNSSVYFSLAYDPVTQLLFWHEGGHRIYSFSLNPASSLYKGVNVKLLVTSIKTCQDIAVDSCGGCTAGYAGERCEVNACNGHCLNSGVCSLNEENDPVCECKKEYKGKRCNVSICKDYCFQGNCSVSADGQPICSCKAGYSGQRCEVNACHGYCLNGGVCSLNEKDSPVCQCTIDYEGERCGVPICKDYCFQGNCNVSAEGQPICSCTGGYSGERCEFNACHDYCFNNGVCFLNEEEETVCQCTADYEGERCDIAIKHTGFCGENMTQQILQDLRSEVKQVQVIKNELQSEVNQVHVIKEDLQRTLQFYSAKNDENEAKIQKCEESIMDLENHNVLLENHDEITSKALTSNTLSETS